MRFKRRAIWLTPILALIVLGAGLCGCLGMDRRSVKLEHVSFTLNNDYDYKSLLTAEYDIIYVFDKDHPPLVPGDATIGMAGPIPVEETGYLIPQDAQVDKQDGKEIAEFTMPSNLYGIRVNYKVFAVTYNQKVVLVFSDTLEEHEKEARSIAESLSIRKN